MSKFKELKQKIKNNKYKIIASIVIAGGVTYILINQHGEIKNLRVKDKLKDDKIAQLIKDSEEDKQVISELNEDVNILKSVMSKTVLCNLREATKRQLRYAEGKLNNAIKNDNVISDTDKRLREEEIAFFSKQIDNIDKADELLSKSLKRD